MDKMSDLHFLEYPHFDTIFLILGRRCNLSCRYCLQHDVVEVVDHTVVERDVIDFLRVIAERQGGVQVQLYGGEPLVYGTTIFDLVDKLRDAPIHWTTITNGRLLDDALVQWMNDHLAGVTVSWDGRSSLTTRGFDVVADRREQLLGLKNLTLSGVLSALTYPLDLMDDFSTFNEMYYQRNGTSARLNIDELMCTTTEHPELADLDLVKLRRQVETVCGEYRRYVLAGEAMHTTRLRWVQGKINNLRWGVDHDVPVKARCGNGYSTLNLDLAGNLHACHNDDSVVGTVRDGLVDVITAVARRDRTAVVGERCATCGVQAICQNGCPLVTDADRRAFYCAQVAAIDEPIVDLVIDLGQGLRGDNDEREPVSNDVHTDQ